MALTYTELTTKMTRLARSNDPDVLTQLKQDMNTGYHMFNAKLGRYYSRKQQFANVVTSESIYATPIDAKAILVVTVVVTATYETPALKEVADEKTWRALTSYKGVKSNWPSHYFSLGNDQIQVWPTPSQNVTKGLRYVYQPFDHDLTIDDVTSTTTGQTVTVANGSVTVTASGSAFNADFASLSFQPTGVTNNSWYEIVSATGTILTLKSPYVGVSGSGVNWRVGQLPITPPEYHDASVHYALGMYFISQGNEARAAYHLGTDKKPGMFYQMVQSCLADYSGASESAVFTDEDNVLNSFLFPPQAA